MDLGFEKQGFEPAIAFDISEAAVNTYNHNRDRKIARKTDLAKIAGKKLIELIDEARANQPISGVVGGPPCQYFSLGNRSPKKNGDPRRKLPARYARILKVLNEKYKLDFFVFENVAGLAKPAHQKDFEQIIRLFENAGFKVFWQILDAYDFGVAQYRKRVFIVGLNSKKYLNAVFSFPDGSPSGLSVQDAIGGLPEPTFYARDLDSSKFPQHPNHWTMKPRSEKFRNPPPKDLKNGTRSFRRLAEDKPSYTVAYGHNEIHIHPEGHRRLSIYEAMLLQGFPAGKERYELVGQLSEQVTLVSDAVPPPLAEALARSILNTLKRHGRSKKS